MSKNEKSDKLFYIIMAIAVLLILGAVAVVMMISEDLEQENQTANTQSTPTIETSPEPTEIATPTEPPPTPTPTPEGGGVIEGALGYAPDPGLLPQAIKEVCAVDLETNKGKCTSNFINDPQLYRFGYGYKIEVPEGRYKVISVVDTQKLGLNREKFHGLYSQLTKCEAFRQDFSACNAEEYACETAVVEIFGNNNKFNINPWDFYTQAELPNKEKCQP